MNTYNHLEVEAKHQDQWEKDQVYSYNSSSDKETFVIDTPPPTVSGSLHMGHIFSYTQTDILARFHRMQGKSVFYPMGWDDNGLPTEKRVQSLYAVRCNPKLDYDSSFEAKKGDKKNQIYKAVSRKNFLEICHKQVLEDELKYKSLWRHIALSVDWKQNYKTIGPYVQTLAQVSFLDLYQKGLVENRLSPVLWDTQFQTAVAQADIEDRQKQGFYHDIAFSVEGGEEFVISTTRPELLPACVAVSAHPKDERYKKYFGKQALIPLFHRSVPVIPSTHADPEKGTGVLMICTFGDMEDVSFCKKQNLPTLQLIDDEGVFMDIAFDKEPFQSLKPEEAQSHYSPLKGLRVRQARKKIVKILKEKNKLKNEPKECLHSVKFYEKGDFPLEILPKRQWYIKVLDHKEELLQQGRKIQWHPPSMIKRYEQWVEGLNQDWCVSRQRPYGVPFPVWYKTDDKGKPDHSQPVVPEIKVLLNKQHSLKIEGGRSVEIGGQTFPIDPLKQSPKGFEESQRDRAGAWTADPHVMDTWATSSLTPYINSSWFFDGGKHKKLFPADLRPQAHEIIRTWAFYTIVKAYFHEKQIPWKNIAVSGWVITPERMKMSKSKGNALTPENLIQTYSADAVRYWAGKARLGQDTIYDENLFKTGKRLTTKIFNAGRFVRIQVEDIPFSSLENCLDEITVPIDQAWLKSLLRTKFQVIESLRNYNHAGALESIEKSFWSFCDNYLELIKARVYQQKNLPEGLSGKRALDYSLCTFLKLFAPYLPYVTEEIWSGRYKKESRSIHSSLWLDKEHLKEMEKQLDLKIGDSLVKQASFGEIAGVSGKLTDLDKQIIPLRSENSGSYRREKTEKLKPDQYILENAFALLDQIRSQKSDQNKSLASPLKHLEVKAKADHLKVFELYKEDIVRAAHVSLHNISMVEQEELENPIAKIALAPNCTDPV